LRKENQDQRKQEGLIAMGCEAQQCAEAGDRTKRSLFAFAAIGLYFSVGKARGKDILIGFLLALPYLLIVFFPSSWVSAMRGIALAQSLT
jgi:hypothetical protein